jgi:alanine or glycine:cation symporter, AGCS family
MNAIESTLESFAAFAWGTPLLVLLLGGGAYFAIYSRGLPYRHFGEALALLRRRPEASEPGDLSHFQSLSTALAGTIGLGNLAGVAVAIQTGGPGAVFWMWVSAVVGIATKFFTCTLAVLYRGRDDRGRIQGGPMYVVVLGLGPRWRPLATQKITSRSTSRSARRSPRSSLSSCSAASRGSARSPRASCRR